MRGLFFSFCFFFLNLRCYKREVFYQTVFHLSTCPLSCVPRDRQGGTPWETNRHHPRRDIGFYKILYHLGVIIFDVGGLCAKHFNKCSIASILPMYKKIKRINTRQFIQKMYLMS